MFASAAATATGFISGNFFGEKQFAWTAAAAAAAAAAA